MTLRQEIEKLRDEWIKVGAIQNAYELSDILTRHTEEPTDPSQRERIATAVFVSILSEKDKAIHIPTAASSSVYSADALIEELSKTAGHVRP